MEKGSYRDTAQTNRIEVEEVRKAIVVTSEIVKTPADLQWVERQLGLEKEVTQSSSKPPSQKEDVWIEKGGSLAPKFVIGQSKSGKAEGSGRRVRDNEEKGT
ncbi:hypothetical protein Ddye_028223 [Dipteronia dyeriana]|uniref:Uncharacterized protein n=1 Tax=Dipteronia dyeriana TaxID=168575 RepID=A0AAD9WS53_9ROSI|nr:hypothetical protein Ddye_028223 [Dipteronia dyeriana]